MTRIIDKINLIEGYLQELSEIAPNSFEEYNQDFKIKAACERYFERIIEAVVDLAFLVIKEKNLRTPEEDKECFEILAKEKIIVKELSEKLQDAKGLRNILAHQYGNIDDEIVFESITEQLQKDAEEFVKIVKNIN